MKVKCKICNELKPKIKIGQRKTSSIFVNEMGKEWFGKTCPQCNVIRSNNNMKRLRSKDE